MGRVAGGLASLVLAVIVTFGVLVAPAVAASTHGKAAHHHHAPKLIKLAKTLHTTKVTKLAQLGHGSFWECPASSTELLIGINRAVLHPGQVLDMDFVAKNTSSTPCNYVAPYSGPGGTVSSALQIGPCGSIAFKILGAHNRSVYPGLVPFNCPALGFAELLPGASVSGLGTWNQTLAGSTKRIAAGSYTLIIGNDFSFPLTIISN